MTHKKRFPGLNRRSLLLAVVLSLIVPASAEWKEKVLYSFQGGADAGSVPAGGVVFDKQGNLYGVTSDGGGVYQLAQPAKQGDPWTESVLYVFQGNSKGDGATPEGGLIIDGAGNLYGTTAYGGTGNCVLLGNSVGCGTVYELSPPAQKGGQWAETVLYSFPTAKQGYFPSGDLVFDGGGKLYGATVFGGDKGTTCDKFYGGQCGTVFELSPPKTKGSGWTEKVLHAFAGGTDGANPNGGLVLDGKGAIYGTTAWGGNTDCQGPGCGTAFRLKPPTRTGGIWTEKVLHRFTDGTDGADPNGGLIFNATGGVLYGTAGGGGSQGLGVVFQLAVKRNGVWAESILHDFTDNAHGRGPGGPLTSDAAGNLYGTALGGTYFRGVLFRLTSRSRAGKWVFADVYSFAGSPDGSYPLADVIFDKNGNLYGATGGGGTGQACQGGCGTVFAVSP
jgi:uncharacterized repeat protein (TIGR03803 family)